MLKKVFILLLAALLCVPALSGCSIGNNDTDTDSSGSVTETQPMSEEISDDHQTDPSAETESDEPEDPVDEPEEKAIDIYFITGQSNATGNSKITDTQALSAFAPEAMTGFKNIYYAGNSRSNGSQPRDRIIEWQNVTIGLGSNSTCIGPEVGMAKAFSVYYNEETGKEAGLIKYAYNGSSLLNKTSGNTDGDGNWVSPSYQRRLPEDEIVENVTGQMYRNFMAQAETNLSELIEAGYTKIRICGMYWMQGCSNKTDPATYEFAFPYFARDVRLDLAEIMKRLTGTNDDCGAANMPIVVGTISQTQSLINASVENTNIAFIEMQKRLADKVEGCYVVDNSAFRISGWENNQTVIYGSDKWHWNQADALTIGKNVGDVLLAHAGLDPIE